MDSPEDALHIVQEAKTDLLETDWNRTVNYARSHSSLSYISGAVDASLIPAQNSYIVSECAHALRNRRITGLVVNKPINGNSWGLGPRRAELAYNTHMYEVYNLVE